MTRATSGEDAYDLVNNLRKLHVKVSLILGLSP
jgi:hypothetical protein